ncbi:MAG: PEP-CTERM sorting domain-containing protein, partial [Akkermansia sp.]|nr:PEP-CTERM sorting domain-containing protein [Akkermansia sp.]
GEFFWLIDAAEGRELVYEGPTGDDAWYDSVFSRTAADGDYKLKGDFNIVFDDELDSFGLKKFSSVPEPTTGTLSLLALAALAARRRRK